MTQHSGALHSVVQHGRAQHRAGHRTELVGTLSAQHRTALHSSAQHSAVCHFTAPHPHHTAHAPHLVAPPTPVAVCCHRPALTDMSCVASPSLPPSNPPPPPTPTPPPPTPHTGLPPGPGAHPAGCPDAGPLLQRHQLHTALHCGRRGGHRAVQGPGRNAAAGGWALHHALGQTTKNEIVCRRKLSSRFKQ
jgi:hypothetical protein